MTKYVIQSGGIKRLPNQAEAYFAELLKGLGPNPKLLWCFFATLPDPVEEHYEEYIKLLAPYFPDDVTPIHLNAQIESFVEQVKEVDVVYLHGGRVSPLTEIFGGFNFTELFAGKVVGTNSASTLMLAKHGWTCDERCCIDGLGVWPARVMVHYDSAYGADDPRGPINWDKARAELEAYGDTNLPLHALKEGEFVVAEI